MIDTPYGETTTVEELHKFTTCGLNPGKVLEGAKWFDTSQFPVFVRVITRPAVIKTDEGKIDVIAEAETTTYRLESEDIEIADNAIWLIVGPDPEQEVEDSAD